MTIGAALRSVRDFLDPTQLPAVKGAMAGGAAYGFERVRVGLESARAVAEPAAQTLVIGATPEQWAAYASMSATCVACVSLFSMLPRAIRAAGWYCVHIRRSFRCFAGRVGRAWNWFVEKLR
jgi:hypothetical protein